MEDSEESTVNQRIRQIIDDDAAGKQSAFANAVGITASTLSSLLGTRQNNPSFDVLQKILLAYPHVNPDWLIHGREPKDRSGESITLEPPAPIYRTDLVTVDNAGKENIVLVETRVSAGYARGGFLEREFISDLPTFTLPGRRFRNGSFRAFQVAGDSMEQNFYAGDIVIARQLYHWPQEIVNGDVHVVVSADDVLIKRVLNQLDTAGSLALKSDNPDYPVRAIEGDEVHQVWLVVAAISFQFPDPRGNDNLARRLNATDSEVAALKLRLDRLTRQAK